MNIETNLLEDYVNFVDSTRTQSTYFRKNYIFICFYYIFVFDFPFI